MTALAIDVHGLVKRFNKRTVVDHVDLQIAPGRICGFLGPNGSGKTTTLRMICGLLIPDAGDGSVLGMDLRRDRRDLPIGLQVDERCIVNAMVALLATGGSTNHLIHWVAVARAAGIVIDAKTGAVRALASWPAMDPTLRGDQDDKHKTNRALNARMELGSIYKPLTVAAAIEAAMRSEPAAIPLLAV